MFVHFYPTDRGFRDLVLRNQLDETLNDPVLLDHEISWARSQFKDLTNWINSMEVGNNPSFGVEHPDQIA